LQGRCSEQGAGRRRTAARRECRRSCWLRSRRSRPTARPPPDCTIASRLSVWLPGPIPQLRRTAVQLVSTTRSLKVAVRTQRALQLVASNPTGPTLPRVGVRFSRHTSPALASQRKPMPPKVCGGATRPKLRTNTDWLAARFRTIRRVSPTSRCPCFPEHGQALPLDHDGAGVVARSDDQQRTTRSRRGRHFEAGEAGTRSVRGVDDEGLRGCVRCDEERGQQHAGDRTAWVQGSLEGCGGRARSSPRTPTQDPTGPRLGKAPESWPGRPIRRVDQNTQVTPSVNQIGSSSMPSCANQRSWAEFIIAEPFKLAVRVVRGS
jgi:hypothetical protein